MSYYRHRKRKDHLVRNLTLLFFAIVIPLLMSTLFVVSASNEKYKEFKEWSDNASCDELKDYLVEHVSELEFSRYKTVDQLWKVLCK